MTLNAVVDLSHHNRSVDFAKAKAAGILGIIHKATEGLTWSDNCFASRRKEAQSAGLLWGAYHFGTGDDVTKQANHFLQVAGTGPDTLLVLDFEKNPNSSSMSLSQARCSAQPAGEADRPTPSQPIVGERIGGRRAVAAAESPGAALLQCPFDHVQRVVALGQPFVFLVQQSEHALEFLARTQPAGTGDGRGGAGDSPP